MIELDTLESQRLEIQRKIDLTKTQDERNKLGQFATPTRLALDITEYAKSLITKDTTLRFLDPAFGTGSFFSALRTSFSSSQISNAYHILYPKPFLQKVLEQTPDITQGIWQALCAIPSETLTDESRVYGGGLHKMEPKELANVPADTILEVLQTYQLINSGKLENSGDQPCV